MARKHTKTVVKPVAPVQVGPRTILASEILAVLRDYRHGARLTVKARIEAFQKQSAEAIEKSYGFSYLANTAGEVAVAQKKLETVDDMMYFVDSEIAAKMPFADRLRVLVTECGKRYDSLARRALSDLYASMHASPSSMIDRSLIKAESEVVSIDSSWSMPREFKRYLDAEKFTIVDDVYVNSVAEAFAAYANGIEDAV